MPNKEKKKNKRRVFVHWLAELLFCLNKNKNEIVFFFGGGNAIA